MWPDTGHTVSEARMIKDLELLKRCNCNHVRTSHYTDAPRWYELCDEYGNYLVQKNAEAAWQARRSSDNLSWCRWPQPTPDDRGYSWGCSSAVVILQVVRPTETVKSENSK
jgi:hypothetical protein